MITIRRHLSDTHSLRNLLRKPATDIKFVLKNHELYKESIWKRKLINTDSLVKELDELPQIYGRLSPLEHDINQIQRNRNQLESQIKTSKNQLPVLLPQIQELKSKFKILQKEKSDLSSRLESTYTSLPNLLHPSVPETEPEIVKWINKPIKINHNSNHVDIMVKKGFLDLEQASITSGTSSYYLIGEAAMLERALINYSIDMAQKHNFTFVLPPSLTRLGMIEACGFTPRDMNGEEQIYKTGKENDMGLVATAEITLAAMGYNKIMNLPKNNIQKYVGLSRSYRAEAGARGKDTKGLYRVHEFSKVELFCWCEPQVGDEVLESLKQFQIDIIQSLGLYGKVLNMPANDLGNPAYKKYDIEVWMPGRESFGEVSSASNCRDFQSRRLNSRFRDGDDKLKYLYTLNGTAMAVPRVVVAIVENFYDEATNMIKIPKPLIPYMQQKEYI
ncbi:serine--tRNA ligase, mitochondrial [Monosporozyma servazzii]